MSRLSLACALLLLALPSAVRADGSSNDIHRAFVSGGRINMNLSAGEYRIEAGSSDRIVVHWTTQRPEDQSRAHVRVDVQGRQATIVTDGPRNGFDVTIQVPARSDLYVRLSAGELSIAGIEGSKDVQAHAGELNIDIGRRDDYRSVDASVWVGEIDAKPFGVNKGGIWRSFDWQGKGRYTLLARLKAGEVSLSSADAKR